VHKGAQRGVAATDQSLDALAAAMVARTKSAVATTVTDEAPAAWSQRSTAAVPASVGRTRSPSAAALRYCPYCACVGSLTLRTSAVSFGTLRCRSATSSSSGSDARGGDNAFSDHSPDDHDDDARDIYWSIFNSPI